MWPEPVPPLAASVSSDVSVLLIRRLRAEWDRVRRREVGRQEVGMGHRNSVRLQKSGEHWIKTDKRLKKKQQNMTRDGT